MCVHGGFAEQGSQAESHGIHSEDRQGLPECPINTGLFPAWVQNHLKNKRKRVNKIEAKNIIFVTNKVQMRDGLYLQEGEGAPDGTQDKS